MTSSQTLLEQLAILKEEQKALGAEVLKAEAALIEALEKVGQKTTTSGGSLTGTLVRGSTITIDEDKLRGALTAAQWKKVTKQVLDKERLEAHIVTGEVDRNVVAGASTEKDRKPFIKVSGALPPTVAAQVRPVSTKNSAGQTKPAAKRRVVKPAKPRS